MPDTIPLQHVTHEEIFPSDFFTGSEDEPERLAIEIIDARPGYAASALRPLIPPTLSVQVEEGSEKAERSVDALNVAVSRASLVDMHRPTVTLDEDRLVHLTRRLTSTATSQVYLSLGVEHNSVEDHGMTPNERDGSRADSAAEREVDQEGSSPGIPPGWLAFEPHMIPTALLRIFEGHDLHIARNARNAGKKARQARRQQLYKLDARVIPRHRRTATLFT